MFWRLSTLVVGLAWLGSLPRHADADVTTKGPPGSDPSCGWTRVNDTHVFGAAPYPAISSETDCKAQCVSTLNCTGIDWNPGSIDSKCWLCSKEELSSLTGIIHFTYNRAASCPVACLPIWTPFANTNVFKCVSNKSLTTEADCKAGCLANAACIGLDWDQNNTNADVCWLCDSASGPWNNGSSPGVVHYTLNRNTNCGGAGTAPVQSVTIPNTAVPGGTCTPNWTEYPNTNVGGGTATPTATSVDACKTACVGSSTCTGIDWDSNTPASRSCWLSGAGGQWFNGTATGVTHYQIVRKTNCASCDTIWTPYDNTNVGGGTDNSAATLDACKTACLGAAGCTGIDWDPKNAASKFCWLTGNGQWFNGTATGVTHYTFSKSTNCGTCSPIWTPYPNTNVGGGAVDPAPTVDGCKTACLAVATCTGIDWDTATTNPAARCWLTGNGQWFNGTAIGVTHYTVDRNTNCVGGTGLAGSVTPPGGTGVPACSPIWTPYPNTNVGGGTSNPATTEDACKAACLALPSCTGYDWDPNNPSGQKCWLSGNGNWFNGTATGVTHYYLNRNTDCKGTCSPIWTPYENTLVKGGTPASATTEDACKAACIASSSCTGIDWDPQNPEGNKCWLSGTGVWVNGTATGVRHSAVDKNPPSCVTGAGTCGPTWVQYNSTLVKGGTYSAAASTDICKAACISSQPCTGIDWDPANPDGQTCWLSGSGVWVNGTAPGVTHYYLIRTPSTCPGRPTTPASP